MIPNSKFQCLFGLKEGYYSDTVVNVWVLTLSLPRFYEFWQEISLSFYLFIFTLIFFIRSLSVFSFFYLVVLSIDESAFEKEGVYCLLAGYFQCASLSKILSLIYYLFFEYFDNIFCRSLCAEVALW